MGALDQFAKVTFAEETELCTQGGAVWSPPPEIGLSEVRLDGLILVRDGARLSTLHAPWSHAAPMDELVLEVKMPGDHLDIPATERALLRRQARQVQRVEDEEQPWTGQEPLCIAAPHVPAVLRERFTLTDAGPGCYRVGPSWFPFLWIAANELPLEEDLIPFLVARSGRALDDFARWVKTRRPRTWLAGMVEILPMTTSVRDDLTAWIKLTDEPRVRANRRYLAKEFIGADPELDAEVKGEARREGHDEGLREGHDEGLREGRLIEGRRMLARAFAARRLVPTAAQQASIDACADLETLERWHDQAIVAATVAEALR